MLIPSVTIPQYSLFCGYSQGLCRVALDCDYGNASIRQRLSVLSTQEAGNRRKHCTCHQLDRLTTHDGPHTITSCENSIRVVVGNWMDVFGRPFVKRIALCYQTVVCLSVCPVLYVLSVCNVRALWPNGWMDQDETWHAGRPQP